MAVESAADRAAFVSTDEFGVTATFPETGQTAPGIFDNEASLAAAGFGVGVQSTDPMFLCRVADLPADVKDGALVTIETVTYYIRNREPDGTGFMVLHLERQENA